MLICLQHGAVDAVHGSGFPIYIDVFQVRNQIVQKWIVQRNSPILFWRFRGCVCLPPRLGILSDISKDLAKLSAD
jgi:hypothetical protein